MRRKRRGKASCIMQINNYKNYKCIIFIERGRIAARAGASAGRAFSRPGPDALSFLPFGHCHGKKRVSFFRPRSLPPLFPPPFRPPARPTRPRLTRRPCARSPSRLKKTGGTVFPIGRLNTAYAKYFTGTTHLASLGGDKAPGVSNVTFAPGVINRWHIHTTSCQVLTTVSARGYYQDLGRARARREAGRHGHDPRGNQAPARRGKGRLVPAPLDHGAVQNRAAGAGRPRRVRAAQVVPGGAFSRARCRAPS